MARAFISHSTRDRRFVEQTLIPALEAGGIATWYSRDDIATATHWERTIKRGLQGCDWFVVVLSPNATSSEWVKDEVHWAIDNRDGRIVPVLLEPCDPVEIHLRLARIQHVDLREASDEATARLLAPFRGEPVAPPSEPPPTGRRGEDRTSGRRASDGPTAPRGRRASDREVPVASPGISKLSLFNTVLLGCLLLAICLPLGAIVVAIAIPNLLSARIRADESRAQAMLRNIASAQEQFRAADAEGDGQLDYATSLDELLAASLLSAESLEDASYTFAIEAASEFEWSARATPHEPASGRRGYVTDQTGEIRALDRDW